MKGPGSLTKTRTRHNRVLAGVGHGGPNHGGLGLGHGGLGLRKEESGLAVEESALGGATRQSRVLEGIGKENSAMEDSDSATEESDLG